MKIGILTGGGDCPGLNAVIRGIVRKGIFHYDDQFVGFLEGWRGVIENNTMPLDLNTVSGILPRGGTILRTSRTNPAKREGGIEQCLKNLEANKLDALIAIGGDDTLGVALKMFNRGFKAIGCPKTIDNDLSGTDLCFGFDTAVMIATEAIDRLHSTAESHNRVIVCRSDGTWLGLDRHLLRHCRRRRRDSDSRKALRYRRSCRDPQTAARARTPLQHRRGCRGREIRRQSGPERR